MIDSTTIKTKPKAVIVFILKYFARSCSNTACNDKHYNANSCILQH